MMAPAEIIFPSLDETVIDAWPEGKTLSLPCVTPNPSAVLIHWYKDGQRLQNSAKHRLVHLSFAYFHSKKYVGIVMKSVTGYFQTGAIWVGDVVLPCRRNVVWRVCVPGLKLVCHSQGEVPRHRARYDGIYIHNIRQFLSF